MDMLQLNLRHRVLRCSAEWNLGLNRMRVLVVEDEIRLAENIATGLREGPGFAVDVCHEGEEAIRACDTVDYDLVILDPMLPKQHGSMVLATLRNRKAVPVLILTAISETSTTIQLLNMGADDYMTKPFDLGELIARTRALNRRGKGVKQTALKRNRARESAAGIRTLLP